MANTAHAHAAEAVGETRRDFLQYTTIAMAGVGGVMMVWPLIGSLNPAADTLALSTTDINISGIAEGQRLTVVWRGKPVFHPRREPRKTPANRRLPAPASKPATPAGW